MLTEECPPLPNIITPGPPPDGLNDRFVLAGRTATDWSATFYNRWGAVVFRTASYHDDWNATGLAAGTYYYLMRNARSGEQLKGWVEVVR